jgi:G3E family GTPase
VNSVLQILALCPDHILIEASGVANPYVLLQTLKRQVFANRIRLESVISLVDITCLPAVYEADEALGYRDLLIDQITVADIVILNKVDLADDSEKATAVRELRKIAPWARLLETCYANVSLELLLGINDSRLFRPALASLDVDHSSQFQTWSFQSERPFLLHKLKKFLSELPVSVLRAKGILFTVEHANQRVIFQLAGVRLTLEMGESFGNTACSSQLVLIATAGSLNKTLLQQQFEDCLIPETTMV